MELEPLSDLLFSPVDLVAPWGGADGLAVETHAVGHLGSRVEGGGPSSLPQLSVSSGAESAYGVAFKQKEAEANPSVLCSVRRRKRLSPSSYSSSSCLVSCC